MRPSITVLTIGLLGVSVASCSGAQQPVPPIRDPATGPSGQPAPAGSATPRLPETDVDTTSGAAGRASTVGSRVALSVRGWAMSANGKVQKAFDPGATLKAGEYTAYYVRLDQPAYVYAVQFYAGGGRRVLFPSEAPVKVPANQETRIPTDPTLWLEVVGSSGQENVYFIASVLPLDRSSPLLAVIVPEPQTSPSSGTSPPAPNPPVVPTSSPSKPAFGRQSLNPPPTTPPRSDEDYLKERALQLVRVEMDGTVLFQGISMDGIGVLRFAFNHE